MTRKQIPELAFLLNEVERKYGRRVATSTDFESLSVVIDIETGELISSSTLKRLWGYVSLNPTPRVSTLDILSRFTGYKDFKEFCEHLRNSDAFVSDFFTSRCIVSSDLEAGTEVAIGWQPNRTVILKYMGNSQYEVISSENSKLCKGDIFEASEFILECPLHVSRILRNGEYTPSYIAGHSGGLTHIKILSH